MLTQARKALVNATGTPVGALPTSLDFGVVKVGQFSRLTGMVLIDSGTAGVLNFQYQSTSGTTLVTSAITVTSGGMVFSEINYSAVARISITGVTSNSAYKFLLNGEVVR
jgi:hypothetical protein